MPIGGAFNVKFILGARSLKQGNNECIVYIIGCTIHYWMYIIVYHVRYLKLISNLVWIHLWLNVGNNYCILSILLFGIVRSSKLYNFIKVFIFTNYLVFPLGGGAQFLWWCAMYFVFGSTTIWVHLWLCACR